MPPDKGRICHHQGGGGMTPTQQKLYEFGKWCAISCREDGGGDLDGGYLEDKMKELGIVHSVEVLESCGEDCWCAEWGAFPQTCLRYTDDIMIELKEE
jgi:hypothetical protein